MRHPNQHPIGYIGHGFEDQDLVCECGKPALRRVRLPPTGSKPWRTLAFCKEHMPGATALTTASNDKKLARSDLRYQGGLWRKRNNKWIPIVSDAD